MANQEHLDLLKLGSSVWNRWRKQHWKVRPELSDPDHSEDYLYEAGLSKAYFSGTDHRAADPYEADLYEMDIIDDIIEDNLIEDFYEDELYESGLSDVGLIGADLSAPDLSGADLGAADLSRADLSGADLSGATLVRTNLTNATLKECTIYGISVWDIQLDGAKQLNLTITPYEQPTITVDNLKIAQFIYLLLNNAEIREVIDTIARKVVLILGRFTPERKAVLDALREALRRHNYSPILFDFEKPSSRDFTETVRTLAHLARFIIADLTDPSSIPLELQAIVPDLAVPVQPLFQRSQESKHEFSMFQDLRKKYHWVLPIYFYTDQVSLLQSLTENVIDRAEKKAQELTKR